jgi:hypothetical protein
MAAGVGRPAAGRERGHVRAADADRERVAGLLAASYSEGRLDKDEYDDRLESALTARTYSDLDRVVADLPGGADLMRPVTWPAKPGPVEATNSFAILSLVLGVAQFAFGPLATIPAIVTGHVALHQIRRTGQRGAGYARLGLLLGWGAVAVGAAVAMLAAFTIMSGMAGMQ